VRIASAGVDFGLKMLGTCPALKVLAGENGARKSALADRKAALPNKLDGLGRCANGILWRRIDTPEWAVVMLAGGAPAR
jgi:hypothetical protein